MRLCQHPDFDQAVIRAANHFKSVGLRPAIIEKDYYVTEALRIIAAVANDKIIFKGGTSLSKGWNLIQRFSEDIDLFLDPQTFSPPLSKHGIDRELKKIRDAINGHESLTFLREQSKTIGGFGRNDYFAYPQQFGGPGEIANRVLLEAGTASGREPTTIRVLNSYLSQFLRSNEISLDCNDEDGFEIRVLHFRRTFVEKLFATHAKVENFKRDSIALGGYARHYYDLFQLAGQPEVVTMLQSAEYRQIIEDYDRISRAHFPRDYLAPDNMSFAQCDAFFPPAALSVQLEAEYETQCNLLCYGSYPSWKQVLQAFSRLQKHL